MNTPRNPWYDEHFCNTRWSATRGLLRLPGGNNSVVECDLAKVEVAGSNPVSRSIYRSAGTPAPRLARFATWGPTPTPLARSRSLLAGTVARFTYCCASSDEYFHRPYDTLLSPHLTRPDSTYNSIPTGAVAKW